MSKKDNTSGGIGSLIILLIFVIAIKEYLTEIAIVIGITLALIIVFWVMAFVLKHRKICQVQNSEVISIPSQTLYGIPMKVEKQDYETDEGKLKSRWIVKSLRPELENNNLHFVPMNYSLWKVKVLRSEPKQDANYQTTRQISSLTKEIFNEINPQLSGFKKQADELKRLEKLVSSSEMYNSKAHLYQRARNQLQQLIDQAENLKREYKKFIREILIGTEIAQFDPNSMPDILEKKLLLQSQYKALKSEFQNKKDEISAYEDLKAEIYHLP